MVWWDSWWLRALYAVLVAGLLGWLIVFGRLLLPASWDGYLFNAGIVLIVVKLAGVAVLVIADLAVEIVRWIHRGAPIVVPAWS